MILKIEIPNEIADPLIERMRNPHPNPMGIDNSEFSDEDLMIEKIGNFLKNEASDILARNASAIADQAARASIESIKIEKGK